MTAMPLALFQKGAGASGAVAWRGLRSGQEGPLVRIKTRPFPYVQPKPDTHWSFRNVDVK